MLYGFDKERSRDDYVSERRRYRPWQGGVYGGTLTFSIKDKIYTAERIFGMKEKEDRFILREDVTNLESKAFSERLGEELFHLDRASFEKTVLLSQNDCSTRTTDRIQAKLGNLAEATDDINSYEHADGRLNDMLNAMSPFRKTGSLYRMKEQITDLESELRRGDQLERELENLLQEKKQTEDAYSKYKGIQEELLIKQKELMFQHDRIGVPTELKENQVTEKKSGPNLFLHEVMITEFIWPAVINGEAVL
jgi:DNA repair exonuclease SbcCD ATPase subunit